MLSDLQRWLLKSGAKSMRRELGGQVRRTLGGGQRAETADIWDTATTEIPPEVGESPECQWCPICRAARRMRDSGPGLGGQLSGAGDAVASAVADALGALDSMLGKAGGATGQRDAGPARNGSGSSREGGGPAGPANPAAAPAPADTPAAGGTADIFDAAGPGAADGPGGSEGQAEPDALHASPAGDHGPGGWKPGDRLATAMTAEPDPWAEATWPDQADPPGEFGDSDLDSQSGEQGTDEQQEGRLDGQGHEPHDRG